MAAIVQTIRSSLFRNSSVIKRTFIRTTALGLHSNVKKQIFQQNSTPKNSVSLIKYCSPYNQIKENFLLLFTSNMLIKIKYHIFIFGCVQYLAIKRSASSSNLDPAKRSEIETRVMSVIKAYDKITADKVHNVYIFYFYLFRI